MVSSCPSNSNPSKDFGNENEDCSVTDSTFELVSEKWNLFGSKLPRAAIYALLFLVIAQMLATTKRLVRCFFMEMMALYIVLFIGCYLLLTVDCSLSLSGGSKVKDAAEYSIGILVICIGIYSMLNLVDILTNYFNDILYSYLVIFLVILGFLCILDRASGESDDSPDPDIWFEDPTTLFKDLSNKKT